MPDDKQNEIMSNFDKFVLRTVGSLLVLGIVGISATMFNMNVSMAKMEASMKYFSEKIELASKDRYTQTMAASDKALMQSIFGAQTNRIDLVEESTEINKKDISANEEKINELKQQLRDLQNRRLN